MTVSLSGGTTVRLEASGGTQLQHTGIQPQRRQQWRVRLNAELKQA
jgi:hypothetical protein